MIVLLPRCITSCGEFVEPTGHLALTRCTRLHGDPQAWDQRSDMRRRRLGRAGTTCNGASASAHARPGIQAPDAVLGEELLELRWLEPPRQPVSARTRAGPTAMAHPPTATGGAAPRRELFSEPVRQAVHVLGQVVVDTRPLAKRDDERVIDAHLPEARSVGVPRVGHNEGVAPIVLGPGDRVPVANRSSCFGWMAYS